MLRPKEVRTTAARVEPRKVLRTDSALRRREGSEMFRKLVVLVTIVLASVSLARDVDFEEFGPSGRALLIARIDRGAMQYDPGEGYAPTAVASRAVDSRLERLVLTFGPSGAAGGGAASRLLCWLTPY